MENSQGNSFIPKSPVQGTVKPRGVRRVYILTYVTYVFFFGVLLATVGLFIYGITIDKQLVSQKNRLSAERELFNQSDLERVRELELRMNTAFNVLDRHVSLHSILLSLEDTTLRPVQISGFEYIKEVDNSLKLTLTARTENFNNALFQREIFSSTDVLNGAMISEVTFTESESDNESETAITNEEVQFTVTKKLAVDEFPYTAGAFPRTDTLTTNDSAIESLVGSEIDSLGEGLNDGSDVVDVINE